MTSPVKRNERFVTMVNPKRIVLIASAIFITVFAIGCQPEPPESADTNAMALFLLSQQNAPESLRAAVRIRNNGPDTIEMRFCILPDCTVTTEEQRNSEIGQVPAGNVSDPVEMELYGYYYQVDGITINEAGPRVVLFEGYQEEAILPVLCEIGAGPDYEITCESV